MSQKSSKSPKSPASNSSSCHNLHVTEENQRPGSALDRLQRQVEEELRQSNRLLHTIDGLIAESKGNISDSRPRTHSRPCPESRSRPDSRPCPDSRSSPESRSRPDSRPCPDSRSSPESRPCPDSRSSPESRSRPDSRPCPDSRSSPESRSRPDSRPGIRYSRPRSAQDGSNLNISEHPRTASVTSVESETYSPPKVSSIYNEEIEEPELPFPHKSLITYGSRDHDGSLGSRGGSKRGIRVPSPESFSAKSRSKSPSILINQDSSNVDDNFDEIRSPSIPIYTPSGKGSKAASYDSSKMSYHTPEEQLSFDKNRIKSSLSRDFYQISDMNESSENDEPQTQSTTCCGRATRACSPAFDGRELMVAESSQNHRSMCSPSPRICPKTQFPAYDEDMKTAKIGNDHHHHNESPQDFLGRDERATIALGHLSQLRKTPSYFRCVLHQGTEFLDVCCPKPKETARGEGKVTKLPKMPCLRSEDIDDLIKCETSDVESVWYLISDEKKIHKKPCPKQQKAQSAVRSLIQTYTAQAGGVQIYAPLEHPDPEDILPEVAAAMMFSQEQGIRMEECPNAIIAHLFPDEPQSMITEKVQGNVSVVDPNQEDQEDMIEKSAAVPSEGVSDSAYTRTMKDKGEDMKRQRSFDLDLAFCQSKPEYVLVTQKPQRVSKVQFRGNLPSWFPGYFSAFPDDEGLKVVSSPSGIFHKAWIYSNPENIPTSDVIVLE